MKGDPAVLEAIDSCLMYERTAEDCATHYRLYFRSFGEKQLARDFKGLAARAARRKLALERRAYLLEGFPSNERYPIEVTPLMKAADIDAIHGYFRTMYSEARAAHERARGVAGDAGDTGTAKLLGKLKVATEHDLARVEGKIKRAGLVGPENYLAHHMHIREKAE